MQFYLDRNSSPSNNQLVIYNPKSKSFFNRVFGKVFKGRKETPINENYDFSNMSLPELYEIQIKLSEAIRQKTEFKKRLQEGVGEDNGKEDNKNIGAKVQDNQKGQIQPNIIPFDEE